jgi:hypothetical protein
MQSCRLRNARNYTKYLFISSNNKNSNEDKPF